MTVAAILKHKGHEVARIAPTATIAEVVKTLAARRIGALLVTDAADQLLGIISERDIVCCLAEHGGRVLDKTVDQLMTRELQTVAPSTRVIQAMQMMTEGRIRHLPVLEDGRLVGLVSIGDIVKARIMEQETEVDSLKAYVAGGA